MGPVRIDVRRGMPAGVHGILSGIDRRIPVDVNLAVGKATIAVPGDWIWMVSPFSVTEAAPSGAVSDWVPF